MSVTRAAIERPIATVMVIMLFVVLGLFAHGRLGADLYPRTNIPWVTVLVAYPGAGAQEVETQVLNPIEEALQPISGVKNIFSGAAESLATVMIEFTMATDVDRALLDVSRALEGVRHRLPREAEKPVIQKYNINEQPILIAVLTGAQAPTELRRTAADRIKPVLEAVPGVGAVSVVGGARREIQVVVDRSRLEGYGLGLNQLVSYLEAANVNVPAGSLEYTRFHYQVRTRGEFQSLAELADLPVPLPGGGSVALREIADIRDTHAEVKQLARLNGQPAVGLVVQKQSDASIVDVAAAVRAELEHLRRQLPPGGDLLVAYDSSQFVRQSLTETQRTLLEGVAMTGLVLLAFLRDWRSVVTVMLAIPTSIVATFMMMYFAGFTFNLLSLLGLTMCVGILVDDSIVVLENIHRHRHQLRKPPARAALDGRLEIGTAAVAITLSDVAVFAPIAFMTGLVGQFFRQFGLTVVFATLFSLFVSFTLTPMLAARLPHAPPRDHLQRRPVLAGLYRRGAAGAARVAAFYRRFLLFALRRRGLVLGGVAALFLATMSVIPLGLIGSEFMVTPDEGSLTLDLEMPAGTSLQAMDGTVRAVEGRLAALPELQYYFATVGSGGAQAAPAGGPHLARIYVQLVPKTARQRSVWEVGDEIRSWGRDFPGLRLTVNEEAMVATGSPGPPVQMLVSGPDYGQLARLAGEVQRIVENTPGTVDVRSSWKPAGNPEVRVEPDHRRAARHQLTSAEIGRAVRAAVEGEVAGKYREGGEEVDIRVRLDRAVLRRPEDLAHLALVNSRGEAVPLGDVARVSFGEGPAEIEHHNRQRMIVISADVRGRSLGDVTGEIQAALKNLSLPPGYHISRYGEQQLMEESFAELIRALVLSVTLVYMILAVLYESLLTPFIRMLSLPCGAIGAVLTLLLTDQTFNLLSLMGIVMLDGLAAKNGTLLIDYTNTLIKRGLPLKEALLEASTTRLRPIIMTSATMIAGMLPTALALTEGSEIRQGLGLVIIGGMLTSTLLTPVLLPVAYSLVEDARGWLAARRPVWRISPPVSMLRRRVRSGPQTCHHHDHRSHGGKSGTKES